MGSARCQAPAAAPDGLTDVAEPVVLADVGGLPRDRRCVAALVEAAVARGAEHDRVGRRRAEAAAALARPRCQAVVARALAGRLCGGAWGPSGRRRRRPSATGRRPAHAACALAGSHRCRRRWRPRAYGCATPACPRSPGPCRGPASAPPTTVSARARAAGVSGCRFGRPCSVRGTHHARHGGVELCRQLEVRLQRQEQPGSAQRARAHRSNLVSAPRGPLCHGGPSPRGHGPLVGLAELERRVRHGRRVLHLSVDFAPLHVLRHLPRKQHTAASVGRHAVTTAPTTAG